CVRSTLKTRILLRLFSNKPIIFISYCIVHELTFLSCHISTKRKGFPSSVSKIVVRKGVMFMRWIPVRSSNLSAVAYDPNTRTLYIEFHSSGTYAYSNVPPSVYQGLLNASSHG